MEEGRGRGGWDNKTSLVNATSNRNYHSKYSPPPQHIFTYQSVQIQSYQVEIIDQMDLHVQSPSYQVLNPLELHVERNVLPLPH